MIGVGVVWEIGLERRKLELGELRWYHRLVCGFGWLAYRELTRKACQEAKVTGVSFMQVRLPLGPSSQGGGRIPHRPQRTSQFGSLCVESGVRLDGGGGRFDCHKTRHHAA